MTTTDLTREQILEMQAGRVLNELVAVLVLGEEHVHEIGVGCLRCHPGNYSTDISAAWLVVEKMRNELMWSFSITGASPLSSVMHGIHAAFVKSVYPPNERNSDDVIFARGETAPLAICRAALLTKLNTPDKEG